MSRVLFVGEIPESVDFTDPAIPPGLDAEKIWAGIHVGEHELSKLGWEADLCMIPPDETAGAALGKQLASKHYDCVVIGAGLRLPPKSLLLFEKVVNVVHRAAPHAVIAFNTHPEDTAEAASRWLKPN